MQFNQAAPPVMQIKANLLRINLFSYIPLALFCLSTILFLCAYYPSHSITFRVEHWNFNYYYATQTFDLFSIRDWGRIVFWTPFGDFRFIPLAYFLTFLEFKIFGLNMVLYWCLSVCLHFINCLLLARLISILRGRKGLCGGYVAAALFMIAPAKFEMIIWTFFGYKLFAVTLILIAAIRIEHYLLSHKTRDLITGFGALIVSWFMYEAALPLAAVFLLRCFLTKGKECPAVFKRVFLVTVSSYSFYGLLSAWAHYAVPKIYNLYLMSIDYGRVYREVLYSLWRWVFHGMVLANSGLGYTFSTRGLLTFNVRDSISICLLAVVLWAALFSCMRYRQTLRKISYYLLTSLAAGSVLVLIGRTSTNGMNYLEMMSIYQYYPTLFLAGIVGLFAQDSLEGAAKKQFKYWITITALVGIMGLMGYSSHRIIKDYMQYNKITADFLEKVGQVVTADPAARISPSNLRLPFTPEHAISFNQHAYQVLKLMYPENTLQDDQLQRLKQ